MKPRLFLAGLCIGLAATASAQTLFTYGPYKVEVAEFVKAFNKNNTPAPSSKAAAMKEYLDLYINSRLKIKEAYNRGYDTLPQIRNEVENLRQQIIDSYINDPDAVNKVLKETFDRSQKDIHVAHIFISFGNNTGITDTAAAYDRLQQALKRLQKEDFAKVAADLSDDPSARTNGGDIGFITVFTLPYELENLAYRTAPGKYSAPYRSRTGYHIFKNIEERKALGKIKAQQILLAFPPDADEAARKQLQRLADSLYVQLTRGADFGALVARFSNDYISANAGGTMPDISVGQYDPVFEKALWSLKKDGDISKPFQTSYGWHILKRVMVKPVVSNPNDKAYQEELKQKIMYDDRWKISKDFVYARVAEKAGVQRYSYDEAALWAYSDSLLNNKPAGNAGRNISNDLALFRIGNTTIHAGEWISYARNFRYKTDGGGFRPYPELMQEFVHYAGYNYYRDHLEDFNEEFRAQMNEFRDGNLFFEIMQQEVWNKAPADTATLYALYEKNKARYSWKPSADAVIFFCGNTGAAKALQDELKKNAADWRKSIEPYRETVVADSARYEWEQLPGLGKAIPQAKSVTPLVSNPDNTASFAYIIRLYPNASPRSFQEARGLVINDNQALLEETWIKELRKKYPVVIDQKVLAQITR